LIPNDLKHFLDVGAFLSTCLEVDSLAGLGKLLALLEGDLLLVVQVQHCAHKNQHVVVCLAVRIDFAHPLIQILEALKALQRKANQDGLSVFIIHGRQGSEPLLAGSIPQLELDVFGSHVSLRSISRVFTLSTLT